ncbi:uncharacterized mitochondrial protein-like protein, partial [Tanacetum coccineum]
KFQMSSMGELIFFLGLQVQQKKDGIFISQDKYVEEILKKFRFTDVKTASTPIETQKPLLKDENGEEVDVHMYRYLKGQSKLGLWYPKDYPLDLVAYTDSDYAGASLDRKSITGGCQFLRCRLISWQCKKQTVFWSSVVAKTINGEVQLHALVDGKRIVITETSVRRTLRLADAEGIDCSLNSTIFENLALMGSKTTAWNEFSSTMAFAIICLATNQKFNFSKLIFDSMVRNLDNHSGKFLMYPRFLQVFLDKQFAEKLTHKRIYIAPCHTKKIFGNMRRVGKGFSGRVTPLFPTMTQTPRELTRMDTEIPQSSGPTKHVADEAVYKERGDSLVRAATTASSLEAEQDSGSGPRCQETMGDTISQTGFENVSKHSNDPLLARVLDLEKTKTTQAEEIVSLKRRVKKLEQKKRLRTHKLKRLRKVGATARVESSDNESLGEDASKQGRIDAIDTDDDITLVSVAGDKVSTTGAATTVSVATITTATTVDEITLAQALQELKSTKPKGKSQSQDKGKGIMIEEPVKKLSKKDQLKLDEEIALKLQAEIDEEERIASAEEEKIDEANYKAEEQEQFTIKQKATLFKELLEQRRKHFAAKRAEEKRNKPPTKTQLKKTMITYLKNIEVDNDQEAAMIKELIEIVPDEEEVAIDAIPLAVKSPSIVDWKIHTGGKKSYY